VFGASGLVATIVTFHPAIFLVSVTGAAILCLPVAFFLYAGKVARWQLLLVCLFVGATLIGHVTISRLANVGAFDVEVVKVWGDKEQPESRTPAAPPPTPAP